MRLGWLALAAPLVLSSCTSTYPYLVTTDGCNCERYTVTDQRWKFEIEFSAFYRVTDHVESTINIIFYNRGEDTLSLRQAYIRGTSSNVRYQFNDIFQPMPFVAIPPGERYRMALQGNDTESVEEPWYKIAGERVTVEIRGILYGLSVVPPIVVTFVPFNPKLLS